MARAVKRILKVLTYIAAGLYLLVDAIFMTVAKPIANWIDKYLPLRKLRDWIKSLPPYPSLALFSVPLIVLEPIKPIAVYLTATGQFLGGALTFIFGELLKLVLVERLFSLTREKLMRIPAFAGLYGWYRQAMAWLKATEAWRTLESLATSAVNILRQQARTSRVGSTNIDTGKKTPSVSPPLPEPPGVPSHPVEAATSATSAVIEPLYEPTSTTARKSAAV
jgi:hypothetical protein